MGSQVSAIKNARQEPPSRTTKTNSKFILNSMTKICCKNMATSRIGKSPHLGIFGALQSPFIGYAGIGLRRKVYETI